MKYKLAIFDDPQGTSFRVFYNEEGAKYTTLVRVSDWVEVDFSPRSDTAERLQEEANQIDSEMEKVVEDNMAKLKALKARKTAVLSHVFQPEVK